MTALLERSLGVRHSVCSPCGSVGAGGRHEHDGRGNLDTHLQEHFDALEGKAQDERVVAVNPVHRFASGELLFNLAPIVNAIVVLGGEVIEEGLGLWC